MSILNFVKKFHEKEKQNEELSYSKMGKALELYEDIIDLCSEMVTIIADSTNRILLDDSKFPSFILINRLLQFIQSIRHLTLKGYYYEASVLERSYFEGLGLCIYLSENFEEAERWAKGKEIKAKKIKLFDSISKGLCKIETVPTFGRIYGQLCNYVHINSRVLPKLVESPIDPTMFSTDERNGIIINNSILLQFDKERVAEIPIFPLLLVFTLWKIFKEELDEKQKRRIKNLSDGYARKCEDILNASKKEDSLQEK